MKAFGGGKLLTEEHSPYSSAMTIPQCIHYALSRPAVASVLPGCKTPAEMAQVMDYFKAGDSEKDYSAILSGTRNDFIGSCVYCSHCQPCPADIDIAAVHKYLDIALIDKDNIPPSIRSHYKSLTHGGDECTGCGNCESRCPFGVKIVENMAKATSMLG